MAGLLSRLIGKVREIGRGLFGLKPKPTPAPAATQQATTARAQQDLGKLGLRIRRDRDRRFMGRRGPMGQPGVSGTPGRLEGVPRGEGKPSQSYGQFEPIKDRIPDGWVRVQSSNINAVRYDKVLNAIDMQFKDGRIARYFNISPQEATILFTRSHGQHMWDLIRVRGKGNRHKHKKPWKYVGNSEGMF